MILPSVRLPFYLPEGEAEAPEFGAAKLFAHLRGITSDCKGITYEEDTTIRGVIDPYLFELSRGSLCHLL